MNARNILCNAEPAGYEKIRKFVLGQISKAGIVPEKLASNRNLAKMFGVSQPTVARALKSLVEDGYLTVKRGIGVFTSPAMNSWGEDAVLVGLLYCDGKNAFLSRMANELSCRFSAALLKKSRRIVLQSCFLAGAQENAGAELFDERGLDAVAWILPGPTASAALRKRKDAGEKVVVIGDEPDGVSCSYFDYELHGYEMAAALLAEGKRKLALSLAGGSKFNERLTKGVVRAVSERGLSLDERFLFVETPETKSSFGAFLSFAKPDGLIFSNDLAPHWKTLRETLDVEDACRLCAPEIFVYDDMDYRGYVAVPDYSKAAALAVERLAAQLDEKPEPKPARIAIKLSFMKGAKR